MSLALKYCKQLAKKYKTIPVYLPGSLVSLGDIITFPEGKPFFPGPVKPRGPFIKMANLKDDFKIGINAKTGKNLRTYYFNSQKGVKIDFRAAAGAQSIADGQTSIQFTQKGASYIAAVGCRETNLQNLYNLIDHLEPIKHKRIWKDCFIVVSITTATKALIMQSIDKSSALLVDGDISNESALLRGLDAGLSIQARVEGNSAFCMNWSENVPIFFKLVRYRKKGKDWGLQTRRFAAEANSVISENEDSMITDVSYREILDNEEEDNSQDE